MNQLIKRGLSLAFAALIALAPVSHAAQQTINHGSAPGDGQGESIFNAFAKVNANDTELFAAKTVFVASFAALPAVGESGKIYVTADDDMMYRWDGAAYDDLAGVKFVANVAALPAVGEAQKVYVALNTGASYWWNGSAYQGLGWNPSGDKLVNPAGAEVALGGGAGSGLEVSPETYGALGNGVADDGAAFQAAFNAATVSSVKLTPGKTYVIRNVQMRSNQSIYLNGATLKYGGTHGTAPISEGVNAIFYVEGTVGSRVSNIAVIGPGRIVGSRIGADYTSTGALEQDGFSAQYADNIVISGAAFEDIKQDAISLDNASAVYIAGNKFLRSGDVSVDVRVGSEITVHGNTAYMVRSLVSCKPNNTNVKVTANSAVTFGIGVTAHGSDWTISGNSLGGVTSPDSQDGNAASGVEVIETTGAQIGANWSNMVIANNVIRKSGANCVYVKTSANSVGSNISIDGNTMTCIRGVLTEAGSSIFIGNNNITAGANGGVILNGGTGIAVMNNLVTASGSEGIKVSTAATSVSGNRVTANGTDGIYLASAASDAAVSSNTVSAAARAIVTFAARSMISSNVLNGGTGAGVSVQGVDAIVTSNKINSTSQEGVLISQPGAVIGNNRIGSGTHGVRVSASNSVVSGNRISGATFWGVNVSSGAVDTLVVSNNLVGNTSGAITDAGTTTTAASNKP